MIPQMYKELIDKLKNATEQKKITWNATSRDTEYMVKLGSSMVTTDKWLVGSVYFVDIAIWNSNGDKVSSISYSQDGKHNDDFQEVLSLYMAAHDSYLKVDETIAEIMSNLDF